MKLAIMILDQIQCAYYWLPMKIIYGLMSQNSCGLPRLGQRNSDGTLRTESMEASYQAFTEIKNSRPIWGGILLWFCNERCS